MNLNMFSNASRSLSGSILVIAGSIKDDIESVQSCWLWLLLGCTAVVAVGVVIEEAVEHFSGERKQWIVEPEWHHRLARIGWVLVIVGVIGEGVFEAAIFVADKTLQEFNNTLLAITTDQAHNAAASAKTAHSEAESAKVAAGVAKSEADQAIGSAKQGEIKIGLVSKKADHIDDRLNLGLSLLAMRSVQRPKETADKLRDWAKTGEYITLKSYKGDVEGFNICTELFFLMSSAKLNVTTDCGQGELKTQLSSGEPTSGIFVHGPDGGRGLMLRGILLQDGGFGLLSDINGMGITQPEWELFIGVNPAFSMSRLEAAENDRKQKIRQTKP